MLDYVYNDQSKCRAKVEECEVILSSKDPIFQAPYRVSPKQREKLKKIIDDMIKVDIIEQAKVAIQHQFFLYQKNKKGNTGF